MRSAPVGRLALKHAAVPQSRIASAPPEHEEIRRQRQSFGGPTVACRNNALMRADQIVELARKLPGYLNRQFIMLLESLGIDYSVFKNLQDADVEFVDFDKQVRSKSCLAF